MAKTVTVSDVLNSWARVTLIKGIPVSWSDEADASGGTKFVPIVYLDKTDMSLLHSIRNNPDIRKIKDREARNEKIGEALLRASTAYLPSQLITEEEAKKFEEDYETSVNAELPEEEREQAKQRRAEFVKSLEEKAPQAEAVYRFVEKDFRRKGHLLADYGRVGKGFSRMNHLEEEKLSDFFVPSLQ